MRLFFVAKSRSPFCVRFFADAMKVANLHQSIQRLRCNMQQRIYKKRSWALLCLHCVPNDQKSAIFDSVCLLATFACLCHHALGTNCANSQLEDADGLRVQACIWRRQFCLRSHGKWREAVLHLSQVSWLKMNFSLSVVKTDLIRFFWIVFGSHPYDKHIFWNANLLKLSVSHTHTHTQRTC